MYLSDDFEIKETRSAYIISSVGDQDKIRISKDDVEKVFSDEDPEMVALLLGVIMFARHNEIVSKKFSGIKYIPKKITHEEEFFEKLNFLLECKMISIDGLINKFSGMKYFQIVKFFEEEFTEDMYEE